ncbi:unnamed protein product [Cuscuta europaea]|nr:unnamed protein product [Cuscuta europaea]
MREDIDKNGVNKSRDDRGIESDCDDGSIMDDTLPDTFEDTPMIELKQNYSSFELFFREYRQKFQMVQAVTEKVTDHFDFHTETPQPFDLPLVSTSDEEGKEHMSLNFQMGV